MTSHAAATSFTTATETPIVLYGQAGSICTRRVLAMLAEKGIEAELINVELGRGEHKLPEHVARQPFAVIPAIDIDGFTMYESRAIVRYIDQRFQQNPLTPKGRSERALMEQFLSVEYCYLSAPTSKIFMQKVVLPMIGAPSDDAIAAAGRAEIAAVLDVLEQHLADHPYLAGDAFSLAEISYLPALDAIKWANEDQLITDRPAVADWAARITARPAWRKVLAMVGR